MWFKGADTTAVAKFVEHKFLHLDVSEMWDDLRCSVYEGARSVNKFLGGLYHSGLWLRPSEASRISTYGMDFQTHYLECAQFAHDIGKTRFKIPPKHHALTHIVHEMVRQLGDASREDLTNENPCVLSPLHGAASRMKILLAALRPCHVLVCYSMPMKEP